MVEFFLILFAPHYDLQKRGFVPCTDAMAEDVANCNGKSFCVMKSVIKNMACDTKVIGHGISEWVKGKAFRSWLEMFSSICCEMFTSQILVPYQHARDSVLDTTEPPQHGTHNRR